MNFTTTEIRCDWYAILGHENGRGMSYDPEVVKISRLECELGKNALDFRVRDGEETNSDLLENFWEACRGVHKRWKLMNIVFQNGGFSLGFVDMKTKTKWGHPGEKITFRSCSGRFCAKSICLGRDTTHYDITIFKLPEEKISDEVPGKDGATVVAVITEYIDADETHLVDTIWYRQGKYFVQRRISKNPCKYETTSRNSER